MPDIKNPFKNTDMKQYFSTLPSFIQESIEQCGMKFENVEELRAFVDNLNPQ